jgi:hypothetical protein
MPRKLIACLFVAAVVLSGPASALATGPSAGDQQYTDPLAGSGSNHASTHTSSTSSTPAPAPAPAPTPSSSGSSAATTASSAPTSATVPSSGGDPGKSLPRTGFDVALGALLGACLLASGTYLRRIADRA